MSTDLAVDTSLCIVVHTVHLRPHLPLAEKKPQKMRWLRCTIIAIIIRCVPLLLTELLLTVLISLTLKDFL